jgi:hypothetical protein
VPERLLDDPDKLRDWTNGAMAAARDVSAAKERRQRATTMRSPLEDFTRNRQNAESL